MTAALADEPDDVAGPPAALRPDLCLVSGYAADFSPPAPSVHSRSAFASGGPLDSGLPDGFLAGLTDAATRDGALAGLDDDALIGVMRAWQRLESWCGAGLLAAIAELARRRPADRTPPAAPGEFPG